MFQNCLNYCFHPVLFSDYSLHPAQLIEFNLWWRRNLILQLQEIKRLILMKWKNFLKSFVFGSRNSLETLESLVIRWLKSAIFLPISLKLFNRSTGHAASTVLWLKSGIPKLIIMFGTPNFSAHISETIDITRTAVYKSFSTFNLGYIGVCLKLLWYTIV